jgi:hypothetical protein
MKYPMVFFITLFFAVQAFAQEEAERVGDMGGGGIWEYSHGPKNEIPDSDCCDEDLREKELRDSLVDQEESEAEEEDDRLESEEDREDDVRDSALFPGNSGK